MTLQICFENTVEAWNVKSLWQVNMEILNINDIRNRDFYLWYNEVALKYSCRSRKTHKFPKVAYAMEKAKHTTGG